MKKLSKSAIFRWSVLVAVLAATVAVNYLHTTVGKAYPSVHAFCPLGGLENLWSWVGGHGNLQKLFAGTMTLFFFTSAFALFFGRSFCGNICPFGTLQELVGKLMPYKITLPKRVDAVMRYLKYGVLALITVMAWATATLWFAPYDPYTAFAHIWSGAELLNENGIGFIILIGVIIGSLFIERFWCRYLCPAGAVYGLLAKVGITKIKRTACVSCQKCNIVCPMGIDVASSDTVNALECIQCGKCTDACPTKTERVLDFSFFGKTMSSLAYIVLAVTVFLGGLVALDAVNLLEVSVPSIEKVEQTGEFIKLSDLRGSMTIADGARYAGLSLEEFYVAMEIPTSVPDTTQLKSVSTLVPGYDFHVIKASK